MIFELFSSAVVGGLVGLTTLNVRGKTDDAKRIARIFSNAGLTVKDGKDRVGMRLLRRNKKPWGTEYAFRIPLGLAYKDYEAKIDALRDGLNNRSYIDARTFLAELAKIKPGFNAIADLRKLVKQKKAVKKDVELAYDGVLLVRVHEQHMPDYFEFQREFFDTLAGWEILVGTTRDRLIKHDFDRNVHLIVAGTTGGGKSVFLKQAISTLVARQTKNVNLYLVDLKGGLCFNRFRNLEQVKGFAKNPEEARKVLMEAQATMGRRIDYLLMHGFEDVIEANFPDRHFIVIDEAADIGDDPVCQDIIADVARRGRAAGFTLIYATQYPTNQVISSQVRQNCSAQVCYRLKTEIASRAVLDEGGAEKLPLIKGRAIYRSDIKTVVQTPFMSNAFIDETIKPNVIIRARKEGDDIERKEAAPRANSLIITPTRLS